MTQTKTHWKKYHHPDYIGAYAFQPGEEKVLTIKSVTEESVIGSNGKKELCMVVKFAESDVKPLICNVTNSKQIEKVSGSPYIEDWAGVRIQLYTTEVNAFGELVDAVRIRPKAPKPIELPELTPTHEKWGAAVKALKDKSTTLEAIKKSYKLNQSNEIQIMKEANDA